MFRSKTLFIVGAGASKEAGLPVGSELIESIAQKLDIRFDSAGHRTSGDKEISILLNQTRSRKQPLLEAKDYLLAASRIYRSMKETASSIDTFLDTHQDDPAIIACGKIAIASSILDAEAKSTMQFGESSDVPLAKLSTTWYRGFFELLSNQIIKSKVDDIFDHVAFITFNYDRCIEHYLFHALMSYYHISEEESAQIINKRFTIIHPYGSVGRLPWQSGEERSVAFGEQSDRDLQAIAEKIYTFTEHLHDDKDLADMRGLVKKAKKIVFLGFAFHPQNMQLLSVQNSMAKEVYATTYGMSDNDRKVVKSLIWYMAWYDAPSEETPRINASDNLTCEGFFREYWRSIGENVASDEEF